MSGGHFDYSEFKLFEISEQLDRVLDSPQFEMSAETTKFIKSRAKLLMSLYADLREIDNFLEGDSTEATLLAYIRSK